MKHEADKCFYNKNYNGWRPSKICKETGVTFEFRQELSTKMGGFASSASEESSSNSKDSASLAASNTN